MRTKTWMIVGCGVGLAIGWSGLARAGGVEELPPEARVVLEEFRRTEAEVRARAEAKVAPILEAAEVELRPAREAAARKLESLQDQHTRAGHLDEALALRKLVREVLGIRPDPGTLYLQEADIGKTYLYEVRGSQQGSVWGSEVYTSDSHLGTAAVHSGVLAPGEKGLVKVRVLAGQKSFRGSTLHGVTSLEYGPWHISFTVEPDRAERQVPATR